jgi:import inner membrane translocase subunit TIM21
VHPNHFFFLRFDRRVCTVQIGEYIGTPMKGYGRDHGGKREGRRNVIDSAEVPGVDGKKNLRIKFNIEGPYGVAHAYAEAEPGGSTGEWVYLIVEVPGPKVITLIDNRSMIAMRASGKGSDPISSL